MVTERSSIEEIEAWVRRENTAAGRSLSHLDTLQGMIANGLLERTVEPVELVSRRGAWSYRAIDDASTWVLQRRRDADDGWTGIFELEQPTDAGFLAIGRVEPSDDARYLAVTTDRIGDERFVLEVRDLDRDLSVCEMHDVVDVAWASDVLFVTIRSAMPYRPYRLMAIDVASGRRRNVWIEGDETCQLALRRSDDGEALFLDRVRNLSSTHLTADECRTIATSEPGAAWATVLPEAPGITYATEHVDDGFLLRIDDVGPCFRVARLTDLGGGSGALEETIACRPDVAIEQLHVVAARPICVVRRDGLQEVEVYDATPGSAPVWSFRPTECDHRLDVGARAAISDGHVDERGDLRVSWSSYLTPKTVIAVDASGNVRPTTTTTARARGHDPDRYVMRRRWVPADGVQVPVSMVSLRENATRPAPVLLHGYGAYGFSSDPGFDAAVLTLVDRGVTYALAHVRGGGELGRPWHDAARRLSKHVSVDDFVAVAEWLAAEGLAAPGRVVADGASAGGTLVTAALNAAPHLFAGIVAGVPLADLMACQSDESMPFSVFERQEWGDAAGDHADRAALTTLCPTLNASPSVSPWVFVTAAVHDGEVRYWQPARYVEALRLSRGGDAGVVFRIATEGGHGGPSRPGAAIEQEAWRLAFILDRLGLAESAPS